MTKNQTKGRGIKLKSIIFRSLFVASLVMIMVSVSFSWFYNGKESSISGVSVKTDEANNLVIRGSDGRWVKRLVIPMPEGFAFGAVTGDGTAFYRPVFELREVGNSELYDYSDYVLSGLERIPEDELKNYLLTCDFSARIERDHELYLSELSVSRGESADPRDYASTVLRLALMVKEEEAYRPLLIWIPDVSVLHLSSYDEVDLSVSETETAVIFTDEAENQRKVPVSGASGSFYAEEEGVTYLWGEFTEPFYLRDILAEEEYDYRLVIWVDGMDPDCVNALMSGDVLVDVRLSAVRKTSEVEHES